ncbi:MAG TPA: glycosyltransferase [Aggregatilineales bacterium]|nr:glycosyltransferase [Aggregatilineales bacterium]
MRFLIVGAVHHPEELFSAQQDGTSGDAPCLFPPSQSEFLWVRALRKLGHSVDAFIRNVPALFGWRARQHQTFTGTRRLSTLLTAAAYRFPYLQPDYHVRNRRLLEAVRHVEPDALLITGDNREIYPDTLAQIKTRFGCKVVYMTGVSPIVFSSALERQAAPLYDLVLVNDYYHGIQWLELGAARMEALPLSACDPDYHHPYSLSEQEQRDFRCDVGFVGTLLPISLYSARVKALEAITDSDLAIWSVHGIPPTLQSFYRGPALGARMLRILCGSKIQINPHGNFMRYGGNLRLFEASACGVFQITDDLPGVSRWFTPGETIAVYRDRGHLRDQVNYYLGHDDERQQIARSARDHVYAYHTYVHRMKTLTELVSSL